MPNYTAPVDNALFLLNDVLGIGKHNNLAGFAEVTPDLVEAIFREGAKFCEEVLQPLNQSGDLEGCTRHDDGRVSTPKGFKEAYDDFCKAGWGSLTVEEEFGGQGLPAVVAAAFNEFCISANISFTMYTGLTQSAILALKLHGSEEQKSTYIPNLVTGKWSATMNLTEPHCGTDLGLLRTKATANDDGSYSIDGTKIFISAGEHDLTENIIHLVLARIEGAPKGTKGISLFLVPKFNVKEDGSIGASNGVVCGSIEEKMGIHGNATCELNYDGARGWLVGEENKGLKAMFTMMNDARLGVALQGLALSEVSYQNAADYARERIQGRSLSSSRDSEKAAEPIIVHPDVRRTLMTIRAFNEAARGLVLWTALNGDIAKRSDNEKECEEAEDFLALITPVLKGFLTDKGFENAVNAQQIFGGHGYIREIGMEQFVRDARIAMIYEGANGVQALDLVARKLPADGGRAMMAFIANTTALIKENSGDESLELYVNSLKKGLDDLQAATMWFMNNAKSNLDNVGAGSTDYLHLFGLVTLGLMWLKIAKAVNQKLSDKDTDNAAELKNKLILGQFYMERLMPTTRLHLERISAGADTMMALDAESF